MSAGIFIPSVFREDIEICVGIDTSGSISMEDLRDALSEILGVTRAFSSVRLTALSCDAEVHTTTEINSPEDVATMELKGGGGTSFKPVFEWIEENKPRTKLLIFFTDGYGDFPEYTNLHTLWCVTKNGMELDKFPFGETVSLDF
jgi:predicted metal-dependent peptidase